MSWPRLGTAMPEQLLDGEREGMLLVHRRDIVEPVEIRYRLQIGLVLDELLGAAMQKPDMRIDAGHDFAVELEHEAQHAVGGRMLRPEIDGEVARVGFGHAGADELFPRVVGSIIRWTSVILCAGNRSARHACG